MVLFMKPPRAGYGDTFQRIEPIVVQLRKNLSLPRFFVADTVLFEQMIAKTHHPFTAVDGDCPKIARTQVLRVGKTAEGVRKTTKVRPALRVNADFQKPSPTSALDSPILPPYKATVAPSEPITLDLLAIVADFQGDRSGWRQWPTRPGDLQRVGPHNCFLPGGNGYC